MVVQALVPERMRSWWESMEMSLCILVDGYEDSGMGRYSIATQ